MHIHDLRELKRLENQRIQYEIELTEICKTLNHKAISRWQETVDILKETHATAEKKHLEEIVKLSNAKNRKEEMIKIVKNSIRDILRF